MTIFETLQTTGLPCVYSHFRERGAPKDPPYIAYIGNGQDTFQADDTHYWRKNRYQIEYYFKQKNEAAEEAIEDALLANGFLYEKTGDVYIEDEGVFVIYYQV